MANLYNAFSLTGVLVGTPLFFGAFYYWIRIFLGNAKWEGVPTASTLWFLWLVASYQHQYCRIHSFRTYRVYIVSFCDRLAVHARKMALFVPPPESSAESEMRKADYATLAARI